MAEVRVQAEGRMWWVQGSGSGTAWSTGATPTSGQYGYVRSFQFTSAAQINQIMERGRPTHHKQVSVSPIAIQVTYAWTGYHQTGASAASASVPFAHLEFRANEPENLASGRYFEFFGAAVQSVQLQEGDEDTIQVTYAALGMLGPTASGYLS